MPAMINQLVRSRKDHMISNINFIVDVADHYSQYDRITVDGVRWTRFWWYQGTGWPTNETDALGGKLDLVCNEKSYYFKLLFWFSSVS